MHGIESIFICRAKRLIIYYATTTIISIHIASNFLILGGQILKMVSMLLSPTRDVNPLTC